ncbi:MAG: L,D-transpeptidase [Sporichthyaceae bacterium]
MNIALRKVTMAAVPGVVAAASLIAPTPATGAVSSAPGPCSTGRVICIDKTARTVEWVVDGQVRLRMAARFGDGGGSPTREGTFSVYRKNEKHVSRLYGASMPYSLFFDGGQAVHYSEDFAERGYRGTSHGCVNTRNIAKMRKLFQSAKIGDKVFVYASASSGYDYDPWSW